MTSNGSPTSYERLCAEAHDQLLRLYADGDPPWGKLRTIPVTIERLHHSGPNVFTLAWTALERYGDGPAGIWDTRERWIAAGYEIPDDAPPAEAVLWRHDPATNYLVPTTCDLYHHSDAGLGDDAAPARRPGADVEAVDAWIRNTKVPVHAGRGAPHIDSDQKKLLSPLREHAVDDWAHIGDMFAVLTRVAAHAMPDNPFNRLVGALGGAVLAAHASVDLRLSAPNRLTTATVADALAAPRALHIASARAWSGVAALEAAAGQLDLVGRPELGLHV